MNHFWHRARRWARRTGWMAQAVGRDIGFGAGRAPAWLRDNPFWRRALAREARRSLLLGRLLLTLLPMLGVTAGAVWLGARYGNALHGIAQVFGLGGTWAFCGLVLASCIHLVGFFSARAAFALSPGLEAERQTLPMLLMAPLRRAEMALASAVPAAAAALIVAVAGLPIYVLLLEMSGAPWVDLAALYVLFALGSFAPPLYARPALSPDPAPLVRTDRAARTRPGTGSPAAALPSLFYLAWISSRAIGVMGGWGVHLMGALPPAVARLGLFVFGWPLCAGLLLIFPLPFFNGHCAPWVYLIPLLVIGRTVTALRTAAAFSAGDAVDMQRLPIARRATTLARWSSRATTFFALAFAWQPWVLSGDFGRLTGAIAPTMGDNVAGLLLVLGSLAIISGAFALPPALFGGRQRHGRHLGLRRAARRLWRPLRRALILFLLLCVCGGAWPFAAPVVHVLERLALVTLTASIFTGGTALFAYYSAGKDTAFRKRFFFWGTAAVFAGPLLVLSLPPSFARMAALSPFTAWLELYPGSSVLIQSLPFGHLAPLPPFPLALAAPALLGLLLATASRRRSPKTAITSQPVRPQTPKVSAPERNPAQTAALVGWLTARMDNPVFLRELRARTRKGDWIVWLYGLPIALLAVVVGVAWQPEVAAAFSFVCLLRFLPLPGLGTFPMPMPTVPEAYGALASVLMSAELYVLAVRGQVVGESLLLRDSERGTLSQLLVTPLPTLRIVAGMAWGQSLGMIFGWFLCGAAALALYLLAGMEYGIAPALTAWIASQFIILAGYVFGLALGACWSPLALRYRMLRGISILLGLIFYGACVFALLSLSPGLGLPSIMTLFLYPMRLKPLLLQTALLALVVSVPLFLFARARFAALRKRDMTLDSLTG